MKNHKNKGALFYRILAIVLAIMMVLSIATYTIYALLGLM